MLARGWQKRMMTISHDPILTEADLIWSRTKGQLISKAIYGLLTSSKKRTDEFDLFAFLLFTAKKSNQICPFFGRS